MFFDFPQANEEIADIEKKVKNYLSKYSVNIPEEKDIERYSDKYTESVLTTKEALRSYLYPELMSPEICEYYQFDTSRDLKEAEKGNMSDLEWDSEDASNQEGSMDLDDDYKIEAENDEDSQESAIVDEEVL